MKNLLPLVPLALLCACTMPPYRGMVHPPAYGAPQGSWQTGAAPYRPDMGYGAPPPAAMSEPRTDPPRHSTVTGVPRTGGNDRPLYGWDGGVVDAPRPGQVVEQDTPRGVEPSTTGRMHIIELYQAALDERDALAEEVETLTAALEQAQGRLNEERRSGGGLESRLAELEAEKQALLRQNQELAARLTTAQIRRLEAEKMLLQSRIDTHGQRTPGAASRPEDR